MATATTNPVVTHVHGAGGRAGDVFMDWLTRVGERSPGGRAAARARRLAALSDEELARLGLERDQIVRFAFRDLTTR